jgi:hypothetical protein
MYRSVAAYPEALGFSLKPPKWLKKLVGGAVGAVGQAQQAVTAVGANYPTTPTAPAAPVDEGLPGWVIPAGLGLLVVLLVMRRRR